jgi:FkbM family methyltransferase
MDKVISAFRPLRFRGKYRLMNLFVPKQGSRSARIFGYRMDLDVSDSIQRNMYFGSYEQGETSRLLRHLRPGTTFVDVGANVGYYTDKASSIVGAGRVIAYEPNPYAYQRLTEWGRANHATNVTPVCAALGSEEGTITTCFEDGDTGTTSLVPALARRAGNETVVNVRRLDSEAERLGIRHIDVMKIDVEGYEPQVFKGASQLLEEGRIGAILCEFVSEWLSAAGSSTGELERMLTSKGFVRREMYGAETAGDRWLVRSFRDI